VTVEIHLLQLKDCDGNVILIGLLTRETFSHVSKRIKIKGVIQPQHNKATQIRRPIRDERIAEILISTELNP